MSAFGGLGCDVRTQYAPLARLGFLDLRAPAVPDVG
jgi:hypothetical protein